MGKISNFWKWLNADKKRLVVSALIILALGFFVYKKFSGSSTAVTYQTATVTKGTIVASVSASGKALTTNILAIDTQASSS